MAILGMATSIQDLRKRVGRITVGYDMDGAPVTAEQMGCAGAMTVLLKDALKPNLIQTLEGQPCFMHTGPFGNIAHGNSSIVADLVGQKIGEYLITEAGFGSDLGMEKFMDIVCRAAGLRPSAVVIVATAKALKHHAGLEDDPRNSESENLRAIEEGSANLERHILNVKEFGLPCVVAANRFPGDTDEEVALVQRLALELGAHSAVLNEGFSKGGEGAAEMAEAVVDACEQPNSFNFMYEDSDPIATKIEKIATRIYRAEGVDFSPVAKQKIDQFTSDGLTGALDLHGQDAPLAVGRCGAAQRPQRLPRPGAGHQAVYRGRVPDPAAAATSCRCRAWEQPRPASTLILMKMGRQSGSSEPDRDAAIGTTHT